MEENTAMVIIAAITCISICVIFYLAVRKTGKLPKYKNPPPPPKPDVSILMEYMNNISVNDYVGNGVNAEGVEIPYSENYVIINGVQVPDGYELVLRKKEDES